MCKGVKNAVDKDFCNNVVSNAKNVMKESFGKDYHKKFYHIKLAHYNNHLKKLKKKLMI